MDKYELLDKELAEALGWQHITETEFKSPHSMQGTLEGNFGFVPRWTQDDAACFRLTFEHGVEYVFDDEAVNVYDSLESLTEYSSVSVADFSDKLSAARVAIVQAVIAKLKQEK